MVFVLRKLEGLERFQFEMEAFVCLVKDEFGVLVRGGLVRGVLNYFATLLLMTDILLMFLTSSYKFSCGMQPFEQAAKVDRRTNQAYEIMRTELRQLACFTSAEDDIAALFERIEPSAEVLCRLIGHRVKLFLDKDANKPDRLPAVVVVDDLMVEEAYSDSITYLKDKIAILPDGWSALAELKKARARQGASMDKQFSVRLHSGDDDDSNMINNANRLAGRVLEPIQETLHRDVAERMGEWTPSEHSCPDTISEISDMCALGTQPPVSILRRSHDPEESTNRNDIGVQDEEWAQWSHDSGDAWEETGSVVGTVVDIDAGKGVMDILNSYFEWMSQMLDQDEAWWAYTNKLDGRNRLKVEVEDCPLCGLFKKFGRTQGCRLCQGAQRVHTPADADPVVLDKLLRDVFDALCIDPHTKISVSFSLCVPQGKSFAVYDMKRDFEGNLSPLMDLAVTGDRLSFFVPSPQGTTTGRHASPKR